MNNIKYEYVKIIDLFYPKGGNGKLTKEFCSLNKGAYPVYTSSGKEPEFLINTFDYDGEYLTWSVVGFAGYIIKVTDKFSITNNRGILIPTEKCKNINLDYIKYIIEPIFRKNIKGRMGYNGESEYTTLNGTAIKNIEEKIPIPVNEDGTFDIKTQNEIVTRYKSIEKRKSILLEDKNRLLKMSIDIDLSKYKYSNIEVKNIFDLSKSTNGSKFTKGFIKDNPGDIPVYGATKKDDEVGYGYVRDNAEIEVVKNGEKSVTKVKYFENCLTYNIDGSAGYIFYRKGKFSLSEKVRPLIIFNQYKDSLDPEYLKYVIQPIFRENARGRKGPNGQNEFTKISREVIQNLLVPIPIKEDGTFNIDDQREIAEQYKRIEKVKREICKQIDKLLTIKIDL